MLDLVLKLSSGQVALEILLKVEEALGNLELNYLDGRVEKLAMSLCCFALKVVVTKAERNTQAEGNFEQDYSNLNNNDCLVD